MNKRNTTLAASVGVVILLAAWLSAPAEDRYGDVYKLPDKAQVYATDDATYRLARRDMDQAKTDVIKARQQGMEQAVNSPEYRAAVARVDESNSKVQALKKGVQAELAASNPQYKALLKDRAAAEEAIAAARKDSNTGFATYQDLYARKEKVTNAIREIEDTALDKAGGAAARQEWTVACNNLDALKKSQKVAVENSAQVADAKQRAAQSQAAVDQASVKLAGSQAAYDEASYQQGKLDDYNHQHRDSDYWDDDWGYGGYGWGYSATIYRAPRARTGGRVGGGIRR